MEESQFTMHAFQQLCKLQRISNPFLIIIYNSVPRVNFEKSISRKGETLKTFMTGLEYEVTKNDLEWKYNTQKGVLPFKR